MEFCIAMGGCNSSDAGQVFDSEPPAPDGGTVMNKRRSRIHVAAPLDVNTMILSLKSTNQRALRRLSSELSEIASGGTFIMTPINFNESLFDWRVLLPGPAGTPYDGAEFVLDVSIPENYPMDPPRISFRTPIYHPNISTSGKICLNILKSADWSPLATLNLVFMSIQSLLAEPNPEDPLNIAAAEQLIKDKAAYYQTARLKTVKSAMSDAPPPLRGEEASQAWEHLQRSRNGLLVDDETMITQLKHKPGNS